MRTEDLWRQLEEENSGATGWSTRFARPEPGTRLLVAIDHVGGSRALLLQASPASIPPRRTWPDCRGLEILKIQLGSETYLAIRLRDAASKDVFCALSERLAARIGQARSEGEAVTELLHGLHRWQLFLAAGREGLSIEAQRGLFGELHVLDSLIVPALGPRAAMQGWKGFAGSHQDFQFAAAAIEVKTTAASVPDAIRITSERQLDDTGCGKLFLHVLIVDDREVDAAPTSAGLTLAALVDRCRKALASDPAAAAMLDDALLQLGWLDTPPGRYDVRRITVRSQLSFQVLDGFPRLLARMLPAGVTDASYTVDLSACRPFEVSSEAMMSLVASSSPSSSTPLQ